MTRNRTVSYGLLAVAVAGLGTVAVSNMQPRAAQAAATVGQSAPSFSLKDTKGRTRTLAEFKGRYVVLEWLNHGCPFVKKHYGSSNMQKLQRSARKQGVVWLSIASSAPGKQGHYNGAGADAQTRSTKAAPSAVLLDASGKTGRAYGAKTTPHMFVINPKGSIIYNGAIDDKPSADQADVAGARNYVMAALMEAKAGKKVSVPVTQPYGCSVKY